MSGYKVHELDTPLMRSEFKLGINITFRYNIIIYSLMVYITNTIMYCYIGSNKMTFISELGKGSYARVIKAQSDEKNNEKVEKALKIQKPACLWEWYIFKEIQHRLKDSEKV